MQIRNVKGVRGDDASILSVWAGKEQAHRNATDKDKNNQSPPAPGADPDKEHHSEKSQSYMLTKVINYRSLFAEILVLGGILQKLEGAELKQFERWRGTLVEADHGRDGGEGREEDEEANGEIREVNNRLAEGDPEDMKVLGKERWSGLMKDLIKRQVRKMRHKDGWDKEDMV